MGGGGVNPAFAQTSDAAQAEASKRYSRGIELFEEGDYRAALIEFTRANELAPNWRVRFNIGQVQYQLSDYAGALVSFQRYLEEGGDDVPSTRRSTVERDIEKLTARVGFLKISSNEDGAEVVIDDVVVGTTPIDGPIAVSAGRRKVTVSKAGLAPVTRLVDIAGADTADVDLRFAKAAASATSKTEPTSDRPAPEPRYDHTPMWIGVASTGVLVAGAVVVGVLALSAKGALDDELATFPANASAIDDAQGKAQGLAIGTDVLGAASLIAAGVTLYFALDPPQLDVGDSASLQLGLGPGSVVVTGTF